MSFFAAKISVSSPGRPEGPSPGDPDHLAAPHLAKRDGRDKPGHDITIAAVTLIADPVFDKDQIVKVPTIYDLAKSADFDYAKLL